MQVDKEAVLVVNIINIQLQAKLNSNNNNNELLNGNISLIIICRLLYFLYQFNSYSFYL